MPAKPNRGLPCAARLYFATADRALAADKVRHGGWEIDPEPCPCGGVHIRRKQGLRARAAGTVVP